MKLGNWAWHGGTGLGRCCASVVDRVMARLGRLGVAPDFLVTLEVRGARSGRVQSLPLVMVVQDRRRYLVSMLGENVGWVRNVDAARGAACIVHGRREAVRLQRIPVDQRARILKPFVKRALGARAHIAVDWRAPLSAFEAVAPLLPVYEVLRADAGDTCPAAP